MSIWTNTGTPILSGHSSCQLASNRSVTHVAFSLVVLASSAVDRARTRVRNFGLILCGTAADLRAADASGRSCFPKSVVVVVAINCSWIRVVSTPSLAMILRIRFSRSKRCHESKIARHYHTARQVQGECSVAVVLPGAQHRKAPTLRPPVGEATTPNTKSGGMNNHLNRNQCPQGLPRLWQSHTTSATQGRAAQRPNARRVSYSLVSSKQQEKTMKRSDIRRDRWFTLGGIADEEDE